MTGMSDLLDTAREAARRWFSAKEAASHRDIACNLLVLCAEEGPMTGGPPGTRSRTTAEAPLHRPPRWTAAERYFVALADHVPDVGRSRRRPQPFRGLKQAVWGRGLKGEIVVADACKLVIVEPPPLGAEALEGAGEVTLPMRPRCSGIGSRSPSPKPASAK